ncbi:phosphatase PAP2 family protein [Plantactinospora sp. GCM10030261]|uniref:phosphatase PAP2 family protein n=1 Tax=Plantactinospora sp. GCM10030261 TaxID=3273420 RepID=UPI00360D76FF
MGASTEPGRRSPRSETDRGGAGRLPNLVRGPVGHFAERSLVGLLVIVGAGVGFGLLLTLVHAEWGPLRRADIAVADWFNQLVSPYPVLVETLKVVTDLGATAVLAGLVGIAAVALLIRRQPRLAVYLIITGIGGLILNPTLKAAVGRLRPVVEDPVATVPGNSFPSGHSLGSFVAFGAILLVFLPAMQRGWRKAAIWITAVLVAVIGFTRVALSVHYVSDVLGAWLLGTAWLTISAYAFRLWRRERGQRPTRPLAEGLEPEAGQEIAPAPAEERVFPHPRSKVAELVVGWVLVFGTLYGFGLFVIQHAKGTFLETIDRVPQELAEERTRDWTSVSWWWSEFGNTGAIIIIGLVACVLLLAVWRRWRPVLFVALAMAGEITLFLATAKAVGRQRPPVEQLDGALPTSSFPSGHIAATLCVWTAIAIVVVPRSGRWWRWAFLTLAVVMPLGVTISRLYRGMHHPTDALGSFLLCALWIGLAYWVVRPNADLREGNRPSFTADQVDELDDELARAGR